VKRLMWGTAYVLTFVIALAAGAVSNLIFQPTFGGIGTVDWDASMGTVETDLAYGDGALNTFDLYLPTDKERATKLVVYVHAGGFTGGDKADDRKFGEYFASRGTLVRRSTTRCDPTATT
jgi:acetyl esterase/lipase